MPTIYVCDQCDTEIDGEYCATHPNATVSSVWVHDEIGYILCCDRCGDTASGEPEKLVDPKYLGNDPYLATGNLCPSCARKEDPAHRRGKWALSWDA